MLRIGAVDVPHGDHYHALFRGILMRRLARALYGSVAARMGHRYTVGRIAPHIDVWRVVCRCGWRGGDGSTFDAVYAGRGHLMDVGVDAADAMTAAGSFVRRMRDVLNAPGASMQEIDLATAGIMHMAGSVDGDKEADVHGDDE